MIILSFIFYSHCMLEPSLHPWMVFHEIVSSSRMFLAHTTNKVKACTNDLMTLTGCFMSGLELNSIMSS